MTHVILIGYSPWIVILTLDKRCQDGQTQNMICITLTINVNICTTLDQRRRRRAGVVQMFCACRVWTDCTTVVARPWVRPNSNIITMKFRIHVLSLTLSECDTDRPALVILIVNSKWGAFSKLDLLSVHMVNLMTMKLSNTYAKKLIGVVHFWNALLKWKHWLTRQNEKNVTGSWVSNYYSPGVALTGVRRSSDSQYSPLFSPHKSKMKHFSSIKRRIVMP